MCRFGVSCFCDINTEHVVKEVAIKIARIKEILSKKSYKEFCNFIRGQTLYPCHIEIDRDGNAVIFDDDFMRWIHKRPVVD